MKQLQKKHLKTLETICKRTQHPYITTLFGWLEKRLMLICYERKTLLFR
jgi:hypothetical protein